MTLHFFISRSRHFKHYSLLSVAPHIWRDRQKWKQCVLCSVRHHSHNCAVSHSRRQESSIMPLCKPQNWTVKIF